MITWENYEEYMMMHADGELQPAETQELMEFINQHPQLKSELADLELVRMVPDTMVYANKASLMKEEPAAKRVIAFPVWKRYSIAAGVAAIMLLSTYRFMNGNNNNGDNGNAVAVNKVTEPVNKNVPAPAKVEDPVKTEVAHTDVKEMQPAAKHTAPVKQQTMQTAAVHKQKIQPVEPANVQPEPYANNQEQVQELQVTTVKTIPVSAEVYAVASATNVPGYTPQVAEEDKKTFWDKLPVDDIKKKQLGNMAGAIKEATTGQKLSVKVEKRKLIFSF